MVIELCIFLFFFFLPPWIQGYGDVTKRVTRPGPDLPLPSSQHVYAWIKRKDEKQHSKRRNWKWQQRRRRIHAQTKMRESFGEEKKREEESEGRWEERKKPVYIFATLGDWSAHPIKWTQSCNHYSKTYHHRIHRLCIPPSSCNMPFSSERLIRWCFRLCFCFLSLSLSQRWNREPIKIKATKCKTTTFGAQNLNRKFKKSIYNYTNQPRYNWVAWRQIDYGFLEWSL